MVSICDVLTAPTLPSDGTDGRDGTKNSCVSDINISISHMTADLVTLGFKTNLCIYNVALHNNNNYKYNNNNYMWV